MKIRTLLFLFTLLLSSGLTAQVVLRGVVKDSISGEALPFSSYLVKGTLNGGTTNEYGQFIITTEKLPVTIIFVISGYRRKEIAFHSTEFMKVEMFSVTHELSIVTISSEKVTTWHPDDAWAFIDFRFYNDFILSLVSIRGKNKEYLVLMDTLGTTISTLALNRHGDSLFTDCLGAVHLFSGDSVYQVHYDYEKLSLPYVTERTQFANEMLPCRCQLGPYYYFSFSNYHQLKMDFYYINWYQKGEYHPFLSIHDSDKIVSYNQNYDINYFLARRRVYQEYAEPLDSIVKHIDYYRSQLPLSLGERKWLSPVMSPLVRICKQVYIVNIMDSTLLTYTGAGIQQHSTNFSCLKAAGWKSNELFGDELTGALYGRTVKKGSSTFVRIDPETGKEMARVDVPGYAYITHPQVRGGNAYFLWKDPYSEQPAKLRVVSLNRK
ncbi:MAG: carboxypeptidase-like regulatory domain-containing protein [Bacteroidota bacterium]|nr:carboxypeptidase-like regulatory domain-containing protein [Bacteroidota bacterium]